MKAKVAINGFGRIGRQVFKAILDRYTSSLEIVAINDLTDNKTLAYLLQFDSVFGKYRDKVTAGDNAIFVGDRKIQAFAEPNPKKLPWRDLGVQFVLESTGRFRTREKASQHFEAGAKKVIISAPARDAVDATIVLGVNDSELRSDHCLISNASCTTNCVSVMAKILTENFVVRRGMMTTIHAYTNDQSLHDEPQSDLRRGRAAAVSLIPAATGAATDLGKVIPELTGKIAGMAVRTPNICGSLVDLVVEVENQVRADDVNDVFQRASEKKYRSVLEYTEQPLVSVDVIGNPASCILDGLSTMVVDEKLVKTIGWYDNEWGYSVRCADLFNMLVQWE